MPCSWPSVLARTATETDDQNKCMHPFLVIWASLHHNDWLLTASISIWSGRNYIIFTGLSLVTSTVDIGLWNLNRGNIIPTAHGESVKVILEEEHVGRERALPITFCPIYKKVRKATIVQLGCTFLKVSCLVVFKSKLKSRWILGVSLKQTKWIYFQFERWC
jgi:hypothetical protein